MRCLHGTERYGTYCTVRYLYSFSQLAWASEQNRCLSLSHSAFPLSSHYRVRSPVFDRGFRRYEISTWRTKRFSYTQGCRNNIDGREGGASRTYVPVLTYGTRATLRKYGTYGSRTPRNVVEIVNWCCEFILTSSKEDNQQSSGSVIINFLCC